MEIFWKIVFVLRYNIAYQFCKQLVFNSTQKVEVSWMYYSSHYRKEINLLFVESSDLHSVIDLHKSSPTVIHQHEIHSVIPRFFRSINSLIFLIVNEKSINQNCNNTEAIKISLPFTSTRNFTHFQVLYSNCARKLELDDSLFQLQKSFLGNENNKDAVIVFGSQVQVSQHFYKDSKTKRFECDEIYEKRLYTYITLLSFCDAPEMVGVELSKIHNISYIDGLNIPLTSILSNYIAFNMPLVKLDRSSKQTSLRSLYLQEYSGWYYYYCRDKVTNNIDFRVWVEPISLSVWLVVLFSWTLVALIMSSFNINLWNFFDTLKIFI